MEKKSPNIETYKQVSDIINIAQWFHRQLTEFYNHLSEIVDKERVRLLIQYMSRHEKIFEQALAEYDETTADKLLKTWIQYAPDSGTLRIPETKDLDSRMSIDDVVRIAMELDDRLIEFYSDARHLIKIDELKDLFGKLAAQEKANKADLQKNADAIKHQM